MLQQHWISSIHIGTSTCVFASITCCFTPESCHDTLAFGQRPPNKNVHKQPLLWYIHVGDVDETRVQRSWSLMPSHHCINRRATPPPLEAQPRELSNLIGTYYPRHCRAEGTVGNGRTLIDTSEIYPPGCPLGPSKCSRDVWSSARYSGHPVVRQKSLM
jgi:hypothetical protein